MGKALLIVAHVAALPWLALCDLPVHCLRHQVVGEWEFSLGPMAPKRSSCGHQNPDSPDKQPAVALVSADGQPSTERFTLSDPDVATAQDGSEGTWTMIYDEGFEVSVGDRVFFAFSKFDLVPDGKGGKTNTSHCDATQVGWYRNRERTSWGCYVARKVTAQDAAAAPPAPPAPQKDDAQEDAHQEQATAAIQVPLGQVDSANSLLGDSLDDLPTPEEMDAAYKAFVPGSAGYSQPMKSDFQRSVASALNFLQLGWTASAYELKFAGKSPQELNRFAGVNRSIDSGRRGRGQGGALADADTPSFLSVKRRTHKHKRRHTAHDDFDWRHKDGKNWLTDVVTQGDCGSCYTISTVHMLTARNKIRTNSVDAPAFSVSFPLYCSEYNQGCDGGYGFLQSKWSEDVGLVPENCAPFSQGGGQCEVSANCQLGDKRYRATNHHYVGGFYGGSDEHNIKEELVKHGPLVMSFEPKEDFMYYKSGVYRSAPQKIHQEWEQVDHAVLLIGYGADKGHAFWTMQNSWGSDWGEDGYFRMARGSDESGCESIVVSADVVEEDENQILDDFINAL
eukprot:TRINITY_DN5514_c0_g1_i1.p1 TRINITY_DN5514_c0_g1~~TRINITY_DN5514_c0_g1_i1.p1  ORF type:complete len:602 (+),score=161.76 TRINITY_DN5514_c0_g1_i1:117-1808(+)